MLEWAVARRRTALAADLAELARAAALEFGSAPAQTERLARTILDSPAARRFFGGPTLRWSGNEVPVGDAGDVLRIDRLVLLDERRGGKPGPDLVGARLQAAARAAGARGLPRTVAALPRRGRAGATGRAGALRLPQRGRRVIEIE